MSIRGSWRRWREKRSSAKSASYGSQSSSTTVGSSSSSASGSLGRVLQTLSRPFSRSSDRSLVTDATDVSDGSEPAGVTRHCAPSPPSSSMATANPYIAPMTAMSMRGPAGDPFYTWTMRPENMDDNERLQCHLGSYNLKAACAAPSRQPTRAELYGISPMDTVTVP